MQNRANRQAPLTPQEMRLVRKVLRTLRVEIWQDSTVFPSWYDSDGKPFSCSTMLSAGFVCPDDEDALCVTVRLDRKMYHTASKNPAGWNIKKISLRQAVKILGMRDQR